MNSAPQTPVNINQQLSFKNAVTWNVEAKHLERYCLKKTKQNSHVTLCTKTGESVTKTNKQTKNKPQLIKDFILHPHKREAISSAG